jgi:cytoskeletal protein RodZ
VFEIGSSLREARTRQGLDYGEVEARTMIRGKYLRALEDEHFDVLPAHTYVKGFLRTYADALGLDGQLYVDEYNSRFVGGDEETPLHARRSAMPRARRRQREQRESHVVGLALAAIALVTALVIAAWRFGGSEPEQVEGLAPSSGSAAPSGAAGLVRRATVEIRATRGDSFMEVRALSRNGRQLYRGTLQRGQVQRFPRQRSVYVSLGRPGNVVVKLNGNRLRLPSSGRAVIGPGGARSTA